MNIKLLIALAFFGHAACLHGMNDNTRSRITLGLANQAEKLEESNYNKKILLRVHPDKFTQEPFKSIAGQVNAQILGAKDKIDQSQKDFSYLFQHPLTQPETTVAQALKQFYQTGEATTLVSNATQQALTDLDDKPLIDLVTNLRLLQTTNPYALAEVLYGHLKPHPYLCIEDRKKPLYEKLCNKTCTILSRATNPVLEPTGRFFRGIGRSIRGIQLSENFQTGFLFGWVIPFGVDGQLFFQFPRVIAVAIYCSPVVTYLGIRAEMRSNWRTRNHQQTITTGVDGSLGVLAGGLTYLLAKKLIIVGFQKLLEIVTKPKPARWW